MNTDEPTYWPFPVLLSEDKWTEAHRKEIRFLESAYQAGLRPCKFGESEYMASVEHGRNGWIISRGGYRNGSPTRWEVWLNTSSEQAAAYWADDFDAAAASVLRWLEGGDVLDILDSAKPHILRGPSINIPKPEPIGEVSERQTKDCPIESPQPNV